MSTFTSSLPEELLSRLSLKSKELSIPKNKIIEKALNIYIDQLERAEYIKSYKKASNDQDLYAIAEEGMGEYLKQLEDTDG